MATVHVARAGAPAQGWPRSRAAAVLALATWGTAAEAGVPYALQLTGACSYKGDLNGLIFDLQGTSANGSPYYKAGGRDEYLYYDADCGGSGDGTPRWILDQDRPMAGRVTDLDNDLACNYHARTNSLDASRPPINAHWMMWCGDGWVDRFASFLEITSTSTRTTVTQTTTSKTTTVTSTTVSTTSTSATTTLTTTTVTATTVTSTSTVTTTTATVTSTTATNTWTGSSTSVTLTSTATETTTGTSTTETHTKTATTSTTLVSLETLVLEGACRYKGFLNGLRFVLQGATADGAPFYRSSIGEQYLYHDLDCNGGGDGAPSPRWIIDGDAPNASLQEDLDEDGKCDYHARLDFPSDGTGPPSSAEWRMFCGEGWESLHLTLHREGSIESANETEEEAPETLYLMGACAQRSHLNGLAFNKEGSTASGAPFYKAEEEEHYIYFDPACDGDGSHPSPRWIIDGSAPNTSLEMDLDGDGACDYEARYSSGDHTQPPADATWRMYCGSTWQEVHLLLTDRMPATSPTTTRRPTTVTSRAGEGARYPLLMSLLLFALALR